MPDLDYVRVVGRLGIVVVDAAADDPDVNPDTIWCDEGTVLFTPLITSVKVVDATPVPATLGQSTIAADIDAEGYISLRGTRAINLVDLTSPKVNPTIGAGKATHKVEFLGLAADGQPVSIPSPVNVRFASDVVDPDTGSIDITLVSPVPVAGGTAQIIGPKGDSAYQTWLLQGNTGTFNDFMAQYVEVEIPARLQAQTLLVTDWDSAIENGWYNSDPGAANAPTDLAGSFIIGNVITKNGWTTQTVGLLVGESGGDSYSFRRTRNANTGVWGSWYRLRLSETELDARYLNIGEGIQDSMLPARISAEGQLITDGDWNNAIHTGWYRGINAANAPFQGVWYIGYVVRHDNDWITQEVWCFTDVDPQARYRRQKRGGVWGPWRPILDESDQLDARYLNIGEGIQNSMLPARLRHNPDRIFDWDTAIAPGWYHTAFEDGAANAPYVAHWFGMVEAGWSDDAWAVQTIYEMTGGDANAPIVSYQRRRYADSWGAWHRIYDTETELDARYLNHTDVVANANLPERLRSDFALADANSLTVPGVARVNNDCANLPIAWWGTITSTVQYGEGMQYYYQHGSAETRIFRRYFGDGVWTAWVELHQTPSQLDARYKKHAVLGDTTSLVQSDMRIAKDPTVSDSLPVGWSNYSYGTGLAFGESANDKPGSGGRYLVLYANANSLGGVVSDFFPVTPNGLYQFSVDLWKAGNYPAVILRLEWFDGSQNYLGYTDVWYANNNSAPIPELGGDTSAYVVTTDAASPPVNADYGRALILNDQNGVGGSYLVVINPTVHKVTNRGIPARLGGNIGATAKHLATAGTVNNWNSATETGWYMSDNADNAPGPGWYMGEVVSHNTSWVTQEVWAFTAPNPSENRWRRHCNNGNWGAWQKVAPTGLGNYFDSALTLNDANDAQSNGIYYVNNATPNTPIAWWGTITVTRFGGEIHQEYRGMGNPQMGGSEAQVWRRWRAGDGNWTPWSKMLVDQIHQDYRFGVFGQALQSPLVTTPDDAVTPGVYDWQGGATTPPNAVFGLHGTVGAQLVVTSYDPTYVKQEARIWDTDQRWVRTRNAGTWTPWVPLANNQKDAKLAGIESGRNLVRNGKFAYATDTRDSIRRNLSLIATSVPGWKVGPTTGNGGEWVLGQGKGAQGFQTTFGGRSLGLRPADSTSGIQVQSDPIPINAGKVYRVKFSVYNDDPIAQGLFFAVVWYDTVDTYIDGPGYLAQNYVVNNAGVASENQFVTYEGYVTAPDLAAAAILLPHAWTGSGSATSNTLYFTDIEFEEVIPTAALGDSGWQNASYQNGWTSLDEANWGAAQYRKIGNRVTLRGLPDGGAKTDNTITTLPVGFRPTIGSIHAVRGVQVGGAAVGTEVRVLPTGQVRVEAISDLSWVSLNGISFLVD